MLWISDVKDSLAWALVVCICSLASYIYRILPHSGWSFPSIFTLNKVEVTMPPPPTCPSTDPKTSPFSSACTRSLNRKRFTAKNMNANKENQQRLNPNDLLWTKTVSRTLFKGVLIKAFFVALFGFLQSLEMTSSVNWYFKNKLTWNIDLKFNIGLYSLHL